MTPVTVFRYRPAVIVGSIVAALLTAGVIAGLIQRLAGNLPWFPGVLWMVPVVLIAWAAFTVARSRVELGADTLTVANPLGRAHSYRFRDIERIEQRPRNGLLLVLTVAGRDVWLAATRAPGSHAAILDAWQRARVQ